MTQSRIKILPDAWERFNLLWPAVVFLGGVALVFFKGSSYTKDFKDWSIFVVDILFLNVIHNAFTIFMLFFVPEIREWIAEVGKGKRIHPYLRWSALFVLMTVGFYFLFGGKEAVGPRSLIAFGLIGAVIPLHHNFKQYFGFSLLYNRELLARKTLTSSQQEVFLKCEKRERSLSFALLVIVILSSLIAQLFVLSPSIVWLRGRAVIYVLFIVNMIMPCMMLANSLKYPYAKESNKTFYLLRLLFGFPFWLAPFTYFSLSIHGVEYALLTGKIFKNSKLKMSGIFFFYLALMILAVGFMYFARPLRGFQKSLLPYFGNEYSPLNFIAALSFSTTYLHYYLDRQIFRMSNPLVRRFVQPLVVSRVTPTAAVESDRLTAS